MGILPDNFQRLKARDLDSMDIFQKVSSSDIKRGDIISDSSKTWHVVALGYDKSQHLAVIDVTPMDGVTEEQLPFSVGNVYRILPLQEENNTQGTSQSNPYISDGNQYPDENGNIVQKAPTVLQTTKGYESSNPYGDDSPNSRAYNQKSSASFNTNNNTTNINNTIINNNTNNTTNNTTSSKFTKNNNNVTQDTINQDLGIWSPISKAELNAYIASVTPSNSPFRNNAEVFIKAGQESGLDPRYILAHALVESNNGLSEKARKNNNYFNIPDFN